VLPGAPGGPVRHSSPGVPDSTGIGDYPRRSMLIAPTAPHRKVPANRPPFAPIPAARLVDCTQEVGRSSPPSSTPRTPASPGVLAFGPSSEASRFLATRALKTAQTCQNSREEGPSRGHLGPPGGDREGGISPLAGRSAGEVREWASAVVLLGEGGEQSSLVVTCGLGPRDLVPCDQQVVRVGELPDQPATAVSYRLAGAEPAELGQAPPQDVGVEAALSGVPPPRWPPPPPGPGGVASWTGPDRPTGQALGDRRRETMRR
jgi:hypothetical protein